MGKFDIIAASNKTSAAETYRREATYVQLSVDRKWLLTHDTR